MKNMASVQSHFKRKHDKILNENPVSHTKQMHTKFNMNLYSPELLKDTTQHA